MISFPAFGQVNTSFPNQPVSVAMEKVAFFLLLIPVLCLAYHDTCVPECKPGDIPPLQGGPLCRCTPEASPSGCQVYACKPGQSSSGEITCMCTSENHPINCVKTRCNNSTLSASNSDQEAGVDSTMCNKLCNCREQPPDCNQSSGEPMSGAPDCSCTINYWPTGCTLQPCKKTDTHDQYYFCECSKEYSPEFCYMPMCSSLLN